MAIKGGHLVARYLKEVEGIETVFVLSGGHIEAIVAERSRVREGLRALGWSVPVTEANFVWLPLGQDTVEFARMCDDAGIVVRSFPGEGCRVTVAEPEAGDVLLRIAARWRAGAA